MDDEKSWRNLVGISASIWTILQMLSPLPTCYYFIKTKTVGDMIVTPYIFAFMSCSLWLLYGLIIFDSTLVRVNLVGAALQFSYTCCYYAYSFKKDHVRKQVAVAALVILAAFTYVHLESRAKELVSVLGLTCCCVTVAFFASPLANMHSVIKRWNSESLPRLLIATTFIVSAQWVIYGYMIENVYVLVTNILGTVLSGVQLLMMFFIPREPSAKVVSLI